MHLLREDSLCKTMFLSLKNKNNKNSNTMIKAMRDGGVTKQYSKTKQKQKLQQIDTAVATKKNQTTKETGRGGGEGGGHTQNTHTQKP